ncbi:MAG: DUF5020 family protein [Cellvibrionaceae bacterium]
MLRTTLKNTLKAPLAARLPLLLLPVAFAFSSYSNASPKWSNISLSYLSGSNYEVGDKDKEVITLEVASGMSWGDSFVFVDRLKSDDGTNETYFELGARYSLKPWLNNALPSAALKDVKLAGQWESGTLSGNGFSNSFDNYLYGIGFDWDIEKFKYVSTNVYLRNNEGKPDNEQLTITWGLPFSLGQAEFLFDGFWDITTKTHSNSQWSSNFTPQLKLDLGKLLLKQKGKLYLGMEYVYWVNKFNIDGIDEKNPNLLIKWHF